MGSGVPISLGRRGTRRAARAGGRPAAGHASLREEAAAGGHRRRPGAGPRRAGRQAGDLRGPPPRAPPPPLPPARGLGPGSEADQWDPYPKEDDSLIRKEPSTYKGL